MSNRLHLSSRLSNKILDVAAPAYELRPSESDNNLEHIAAGIIGVPIVPLDRTDLDPEQQEVEAIFDSDEDRWPDFFRDDSPPAEVAQSTHWYENSGEPDLHLQTDQNLAACADHLHPIALEPIRTTLSGEDMNIVKEVAESTPGTEDTV